jgi:hypothetical protein
MFLKLDEREIKARATKRSVKILTFVAPLLAASIGVVIFSRSYGKIIGGAIATLLLFYLLSSLLYIKRIASLEVQSIDKNRQMEELMLDEFFTPKQEADSSHRELDKVEDSLDESNDWSYTYPIPSSKERAIYSIGVGVKNKDFTSKKQEVTLRVKRGALTIKEQKSQWGCFISVNVDGGDDVKLEVSSPRKVNLSYVLSISAS